MIVPISAKFEEKYNKEKLILYMNGQKKELDIPILPYFYSNKKYVVECEKISQVEGIAISNFQKKQFYKYEFTTRKKLVLVRDALEREHGSECVFEARIPFVLRNRIDNENLFLKFPQSKDLVFLFLDIEQYVRPEKMFPDYTDRIISISYCTNDRNIKSIYLKKDNPTDKKLLQKFIEVYKEINPDVLVVYNQKYDLPTLFFRCEKNRIDSGKFSKTGQKPYIKGNEIDVEGIVVYDVLNSTMSDQSLTGNTVDKKLKSVSNWYGFKEERKPLTVKEITESIGSEKLISYNKDDVRRLLVLFDVYWDNILFNSQNLKLPLNYCVNLNTTDLGLIVLGSEYKEKGIVSDGNNYARYPEIFQRKKEGYESNYQGALVELYKNGLYKPVFKADYSSLYPSIMATFNLSPDTTTLLAYDNYDGIFKIEEEKDWFVYHIPDNVLNKNMIIQVSKTPGFMSQLVNRFLKERSSYKKQWKETGDKKYRCASDVRKLKANGVYGVLGSAKHSFGFAPIAIATTGIGRECAKLLIGVLNTLYPDSVLEADTDGVYYSCEKSDEKTILDLFNNKLKEKFKKDLDLSIDVDSYDSGYFYKSKNYVLTKGEKIIYHGVAMKASSKDLLSKSLIESLATLKLAGKSTDEVVEKYFKLDFPLNYFVMNVTMGMHIKQYSNLNSLVPRLALTAERCFGLKPEIGNQYYYVKSNDGYTLFELAKKENLDLQYYREEIQKIVEIFDVKPMTNSIDKWV